MSENETVQIRAPRLSDAYCWPDIAFFPPEKHFYARLPWVSDWLFLGGFLGCIARFAPRFEREGYSRELFWEASVAECKMLQRFGTSVEAVGLDHLRERQGRPTVIIGNHMSMLETVVLPALILPELDVTSVVKEALLKTPFMGTILKSVGAIAVGRANPRNDLKAVLEEGKKALAAGRSVVIFPQSTRCETFNSSQFSSIGVKLAKSANVPVIPLALRTDFLQNGKWVKELGRINPARPPVRFAFGAPLSVDGNGKEAQEAVLRFIETKMREWGVKVETSA